MAATDFSPFSLLLLALFAVISPPSAVLLADGADILISPSWLSPMHRYTMRELAAELVRRKHTVHWLEYGLHPHSSIPLPPGVQEHFLQVKSAPKTAALLDARGKFVQLTSAEQLWRPDFWQPVEKLTGWLASIELCHAVLADPAQRRMFDQLAQKQFVAVVVDDLFNPCALLHAGLQKSLFVYWSLTGLRTESAWANQSPSPPSYIPVAGTGLTDDLSFWQRSHNLLAYLRQLYLHQHIVLRRLDRLFRRHFPKQQLADAFTLERNASINFVNHPPIFDFPRPYMPRVNFVGGLHCKNQSADSWSAKEHKALLEFVDGSNEQKGFYLLTGGFSLNWNVAPPETIQNLVDAIAEMSDIRFVWQYNGPALKKVPKNLFTAQWLPQQALLAHSKCRAHVSHGGLNSVVESVWHGVPVIGWPLSADARDNLVRLTARQCGLMLDGKRPTRQQFISAFHRIQMRFYKEEMLVFQDMVRDVPYTELDHAAFWVEFIVRHQEVPHARSGADQLNIFQYFLVDAVLFLLGVTLLLLYLVLWLLRMTARLILYLLRLPFQRRMAKKAEGEGKRKEKEPAAKKKD